MGSSGQVSQREQPWLSGYSSIPLTHGKEPYKPDSVATSYKPYLGPNMGRYTVTEHREGLCVLSEKARGTASGKCATPTSRSVLPVRVFLT